MTYAHFPRYVPSVRPMWIPTDEKDGRKTKGKETRRDSGGWLVGWLVGGLLVGKVVQGYVGLKRHHVPTACPSLFAGSFWPGPSCRVMNDRTDKTSKQMKSGPDYPAGGSLALLRRYEDSESIDERGQLG